MIDESALSGSAGGEIADEDSRLTRDGLYPGYAGKGRDDESKERKAQSQNKVVLTSWEGEGHLSPGEVDEDAYW